MLVGCIKFRISWKSQFFKSKALTMIKLSNLFYVFLPVWPVQRWWQRRCDWKPLKHFESANGQNQVTTNTYYTLVNKFWQMVINMYVLIFTGGMEFLVCTKAWRQSCCRRYWQLPSCLLYMRRSLLLRSKSWALTRSWSSEHASTWIQYCSSSRKFW